MPDEKKATQEPKAPQGVSPISGTPTPVGRPWTKGDPRARAAGLKSQAVQKKRRTMKQDLITLLEAVIEGKDGTSKRAQEHISLALIAKAMNGDTRAFEVIRDTIGEKPVEKVESQQVHVDLSNLSTDEIKAILDSDVNAIEND